MMQKFRAWIFGSLQVKVLLLIISVMFLLLAVFVFYNVRIQRTTLEAALEQKGTSMALTGATAVGHLLEDAIASGRFTEDEIFDTNYQPIPNTNPQKYSTVYDDFTDANLLEIQDVYLEDPDVLFAVTVDTNGYLPTHNTRYSNPLTGDYETDLSGNRTKRIFDDEVGFAAAKNTDPSLFQIYFRDTGEVAWDISAPIWVNGKHWGGFRVAFSLEDINAQTSALTWQIGIAAALLVVAVGLAAFLIARQIAHPIRNLADVAQKFGEGNFDARVKATSQDELGQLGRSFNRMAEQQKGLIDTLEYQVRERTRRLEVVAELSGQLVSILDFEQLISEMVNQIKTRFGYYHVQVYLSSPADKSLVLAGGTGEAGRIMVAQNHTIQVGRGFVGTAAQQKEVVLASNLSPIIAPEVVSANTVETVIERETDDSYRSHWYHNYINQIFGSLDDLLTDESSDAGSVKLGYILLDFGEFLKPIIQGAKEAARDLGVDLEIAVVSYDTKADPMVERFNQMVAAGKDGIVVIPQEQHVWPPYFNKAAELGIPVVTVNLTGPDIENWAWFGQDGYQGGFSLAVEFRQYLQAAGLETGEIVVGISGTPEAELVARYEGFKAGLAGTDFTFSSLFHSSTVDPEEDKKVWTEFINAHPQLVAAVGLTALALPTLSRIKTETDADWLIGGFDLELETIEALKTNVAQVTVAQHPYLQGYLPVLALIQYLRLGKPLEDWMVKGWLPNPLLPDTKAEVSVPIMLEGEVAGVLDVQSDKVGGVDENDATLLQSLANQVAEGIRNAQQFEQVQQALARAQAIQEQYVEQAWDRNKVLKQDTGQVRFSIGESRTLTEDAVSEARKLAFSHAEPVTASFDNGQDTAFIAPIKLRNTTVGNLQLHGLETGDKLTDSDRAMIAAIVDQVALAAENLRLINETRERASREQLITRVSDKLRRAPDLETLMNIGVQEIAQVLGASRTFVRLGSEDEFVGNHQPDEEMVEQAESLPESETLEAESETGNTAPEEPPVLPATNGRGDK